MIGGMEDQAIRALTPDTFGDLARLVAAPGGPRHCWGRVWRAPAAGGERRHAGRAAGGAARGAGASVLEACPVDPESPGYRFMSFVPVFAGAGFAEAGRIGARRHVMRLNLSA